MGEPEARAFTDPQRLRDVVSDLVGAPTSMQRLAGGSKKGVYRVELSDGSAVVAYVWDAAENFWEPQADEVEPFTDASGQELFLAAHQALRRRDLRTLEILGHRGDVTLVEDLPGGTLERLMAQDPAKAETALAPLRAMLDALHAERSTTLGKIGRPLPTETVCEHIAYDRARRHLSELRARAVPIRAELESVLLAAFHAVRPRSSHTLIHGELGPDHVLLDSNGLPVLIDVEGLMYFDLEWEHAFMRLRFGRAYSQLETPFLDDDRMRLYTLCLRLSLVAGPLRLLDGDFPRREAMLAIVDANLAALDAM